MYSQRACLPPSALCSSTEPQRSPLTLPQAHYPPARLFSVWVCACVQTSCAAGQLMERKKKGQEGSAVARCGVSLLLLGNEEWEAQEEKEQEDEEE